MIRYPLTEADALPFAAASFDFKEVQLRVHVLLVGQQYPSHTWQEQHSFVKGICEKAHGTNSIILLLL